MTEENPETTPVRIELKNRFLSMESETDQPENIKVVSIESLKIFDPRKSLQLPTAVRRSRYIRKETKGAGSSGKNFPS